MTESQNGIHRRADLMAHIGKEHAFGFACRFRFHCPLFQRFIFGKNFIPHVIDAIKTLDQHITEPHQYSCLKRNNHRMKQDAQQVSTFRKHGGRHQIIQCQMVYGNGSGRKHHGTAVTPCNGQSEHSKEIHMYIHLPEPSAHQIQD